MFSRLCSKVSSTVSSIFFSGESSALTGLSSEHLPTHSISLSISETESNFLAAIKVNKHALFREAAKNIKLYSIVRTTLFKAGNKEEELQQLLNSSFYERYFEEDILCTPLMALIFETIRRPPADYTNFTTLLLQFSADGAELNTVQLNCIRNHLNKLKKITEVSSQFTNLLNQWMDALPQSEEEEKRSSLPLENRPADYIVIEVRDEEVRSTIDDDSAYTVAKIAYLVP